MPRVPAERYPVVCLRSCGTAEGSRASIGYLSSSNGYREFDDTAIQTVTTIRTLFELGFPSELVSRVLPCTGEAGPIAGECGALMRRVIEIRDEMDEKARRLDATRDQLTQFLETANRR